MAQKLDTNKELYLAAVRGMRAELEVLTDRMTNCHSMNNDTIDWLQSAQDTLENLEDAMEGEEFN